MFKPLFGYVPLPAMFVCAPCGVFIDFFVILPPFLHTLNREKRILDCGSLGVLLWMTAPPPPPPLEPERADS